MHKQKSFTMVSAPALAIALSGILVPRQAAALDEAHAYGIANFGHAGECSSDTSLTHSVHTETAQKFIDAFDDLIASGDWDQTDIHNNTAARGSYFTDTTKAASCSCTADDMRSGYGVDEADVMFVHTHGGHVTSTSSYLLTGSSSYDCYAYTNSNMYFNASGAGDLDIAVVKACQSGDYNVFLAGGYRPQLTDSGSSFTVWNAFHGDSSCGSHVKGYVSDYAKDSTFDGVGENWIDEAYDNAFWPWETDDCPVSIVMGSTESLADHMYTYGGWKDRENTGSKTSGWYYWVSGCAPTSGVVLP